MVIMHNTLTASELNIFHKKLKNSQFTANNYRMQANDLIMCGYFCIEFIDFTLKGKSLIDYNNLFSPNGYEKKNYKMILKFS